MHKRFGAFCFLFWFLCWFLIGPGHSHIATAASGDASDAGAYNPRNSYEFGVNGAVFLPHNIPGVTEIVPGWGVLAAVPTSKGVFEATTFFGRGRGVAYDSVAASYRYDIPFNTVETHAFFGVHADTYTSDTESKSFAGGWNFGGGLAFQLAGPIYLRADFRDRLGPGNSLVVTMGLDYRMPSDGTQ